MGSNIVNFTERLLQPDAISWYHGFARNDVLVSSLTPENRGNLRAGMQTLHRYQSFTDDVCCSLEYWLPRPSGPTGSPTGLIATHNMARLTFFIAGGMEIPHLGINLRLEYKGNDGNNRELRLVMIWTAWDDCTFHQPRHQWMLDGSLHTHSFSGRLRLASVDEISLNNDQAFNCQSNVGTPAFRFRWASDFAPYCFGLSVTDTELEPFTDVQKYAIGIFVEAATANRFTVICPKNPALEYNWNQLRMMPSPTLPPFPLYDCRFDTVSEQFSPMEELPSTSDLHVEIHHRVRKVDWAHINETGPCFTEPFTFRHSNPKAPLTFINERHYQAIRSIGLLRDVSTDKMQHRGLFNAEYTFDLFPAGYLDKDLASPDTCYYIALQFKLRVYDPDREHSESLPSAGTPITVVPKMQMDRSLKQPKSSNQSICEQLDTRDEITRSATNYHQFPGNLSSFSFDNPTKPCDKVSWHGYIVSLSPLQTQRLNAHFHPNIILAKIQKPAGIEDVPTGKITSMIADISFDYDKAPKRAEKQAIQHAMWGDPASYIPRVNRIKNLLLARENAVMNLTLTRKKTETFAHDFLKSLAESRNEQQKRAIGMALSFAAETILTLVEGPPGTGKTAVSSSIIKYCYENHLPVLVTCGTDRGLEIILQRFSAQYKPVTSNSENLDGVYRLGKDLLESAEIPEEKALSEDEKERRLKEQFPILPPEKAISEALITELEGSIKALGEDLEYHSLSRYIVLNVRKLHHMPAEDTEAQLFLELIRWQHYLVANTCRVEPILVDGDPPNDIRFSHLHRELHKQFIKAWENLQDSYLSRARVVFCTAGTASRKVLRRFHPAYVLVEEASEIPESTCLVPLMSSYQNLRKVILTGDLNLFPRPKSRSHNECFWSERLSLFGRMILSGHPSIKLSTQYRMPSDICRTVSKLFYRESLKTEARCDWRLEAVNLTRFVTETYHCKKGRSFFFSISGSMPLQRKGSTSIVSPQHVSFICSFIERLLAFVDGTPNLLPGVGKQDIMVLSYYNEEIRCLNALFRQRGWEGIRVKSVDSAQGSEAGVVIISATFHPIPRFRFVRDYNRCCIALSRAKFCRIIVSQESIQAHDQLPWGRVVEDHQIQGTICHIEGDDKIARNEIGLFAGNADFMPAGEKNGD